MSVPEGARGYDGPKLEYSYDYDTDTMTVEGQRYSGLFLRELGHGGAPSGSLLEITREGNDVLSLKRIYTPGEKETEVEITGVKLEDTGIRVEYK